MKTYLTLFVILIYFVCITFIYLGFKGQSENSGANGITMDSLPKEAKPHCNCGIEVLSVILNICVHEYLETSNRDALPVVDSRNNIEVPENSINVSNSTMQEIQQLIDPLMNDGNHGIQLFLSLLHFLQARHPSRLSESQI